jgi:hypothetical protein
MIQVLGILEVIRLRVAILGILRQQGEESIRESQEPGAVSGRI